MTVIPPYLKKGDCIGIVCPSGYMPFEKIKVCIKTLRQWGYKVKPGETTNSQFNYFSGTDEDRLHDLQSMLDDGEVKAILCGRGGYGLSRIIDQLDLRRFKKDPKWIIGYSDITLLHLHLFAKLKIASLHAPMAAAFNDAGHKNKFVRSLKNALSGVDCAYSCNGHAANRTGESSGLLIGGNLALAAHSIGSPSEIDTKNNILFLEDLGEYLYNIDRMMMQLKRAGKLDHLSGLIFGNFTGLKDTTTSFGSDIYTILYDKVKEYSYPVCFDFPVGHTEKNYALKCGVMHELSVTAKKISLKEISE